jgi:hypothetical protein
MTNKEREVKAENNEKKKNTSRVGKADENNKKNKGRPVRN